jgi:exonuclease SbcC
MILKSLIIKNFRKFKNITVEFPDGVTGIVGLNGSGKSTIIEAIAWVLYGPVAARTGTDQIKRRGSETKDGCRVELEFVFENEYYRIIREITGKNLTATATATINGKIAATSPESVNLFIRKKLGMDFKSFFTSIFAKQKELNTLSNMNNSERRPLILRMLDINSLDDVIREIRLDKKNKELLIQKLIDGLTDQEGKVKEELYNEKIKNLENKKKNFAKEINQLREKIKIIKNEIILQKNQNEQNKIRYEKIKKEREHLSNNKILFERKNKFYNELKSLTEKINDRDNYIEKEKMKLNYYKSCEKDIKICDRRTNEIEDILEKIVKKIEQKKTYSKRLESDLSDVITKREKIEKLGPSAICPTCEQTLTNQYNFLIKKYTKKENKINRTIKDFSTIINNEEEKKQRTLREYNALKRKRNHLQDMKREKELVKGSIKHNNIELIKERDEYKNIKNEFNKIETINFDIKQYELIIEKLDTTYKDYQLSLKKYNEKKDLFSKILIEAEKKEGEQKLIIQEIKNYFDKINEIKKYKKKIREEKTTVNYINILNEVMNDFRNYLISRIRPTLSHYSSDFFNNLTNGKYSEIELDENYNLLIYDNGERYRINRFSGGEEDLANLCLRLAISEVITERAGGILNFIILDEIFGSQDELRRKNIMNALSSLSYKFRQIFLVTHVEDVKNYMENIISVIENEDGTSSIKIE